MPSKANTRKKRVNAKKRRKTHNAAKQMGGGECQRTPDGKHTTCSILADGRAIPHCWERSQPGSWQLVCTICGCYA